MAHRILPSLPRIKVDIGHIPQRLKIKGLTNPQARLEILRRLVCRMIREERCEMKYNKAEECRQYLERIIQIGIHRRPDDEYANDMINWWIIEEDLKDKLYNVLVPRFENASEPYTSLYSLPKIHVQTGSGHRFQFYKQIHVGVLELNGNPFPSMAPLELRRQEALASVVRKNINEYRL